MIATRPPVGPNGAASDDRLVEAACAGLEAYHARPALGLSTALRDRAWPLILELFVAARRAMPVPVKAACLILGGPPTTALRCILELERSGVVRSTSDAHDARRRLLALTPTCETATRDYLFGRATPTLRMSLRLATRQTAEGPPSARANLASPVDRTGSGPDTLLQIGGAAGS